MKALIWKEVRQQLVWLFVALSLATQMWFGMGSVWGQLVRPTNETALWSLAYPLLYAFALAQLQFGRDGDTRHFGLLVHRAQGARGYFASKVIVGVTALACVVVLPVTIWALTQALLDPDAALIRWVRVPQSCIICIPALLVYAMGVLSTQLRRGALLRWTVALAGIFGAFLIAFPLALLIGPGRVQVIAWIGTDVLCAFGVLWLARALLLQGRDRDLPLRDRQLCGVALVAFLVLVPLCSFLLGSAESAALSVIVEAKPAVLFDTKKDALVFAGRTEEGWHALGGSDAAVKGLEQVAEGRFVAEDHQVLDVVHYAGSRTVEGVQEAREYLEAIPRCRSLHDPAPRDRTAQGVAYVRAADGQARPVGDDWTVLVELDEEDGALHLAASRSAARLPPLQASARRPDGKFSAQAGFLGFRTHAPIVLDRADGTLWRVRLEQDGVTVVPIELPGGDRVTALEPLFRRQAAVLGRFEQQYFDDSERSTGCAFVGRLGRYLLLKERIVSLDDAARPADSVTYEEAQQLAKYAVTSTWPDAFTEQIRVEQLADHQTVFECSAGPETSGARRAAILYGGLALLRAPAGVLAERILGWRSDAGMTLAPFAKERMLFTDGRHPLLFALLMLGGALQFFLGWRWLERSGAGFATRIVGLLLIATGGVVALFFVRALLPRHARSTPAAERLRAEAPLAARA